MADELRIPDAASKRAERALGWIDRGVDAMTETGRRRARQIAAGGTLSEGEAREIRNWFARHAAFREHHNRTSVKTDEEAPTRALVSWWGWGGDPMLERVEEATGKPIARSNGWWPQSPQQRIVTLAERWVESRPDVGSERRTEIEKRLLELAQEAGAEREVRQLLQGPTLSETGLAGTDFVLVGIGRALELEDGRELEIEKLMFAPPSLDALLFLPPERVRRDGNAETDDSATDAFETWHHFEPQGEEYELQVPIAPAWHLPPPVRIDYESDKVVREGDEPGETHHYYHFSEERHTTLATGPDGEAILVGFDVEGDAIVNQETLEIDGRGILN